CNRSRPPYLYQYHALERSRSDLCPQDRSGRRTDQNAVSGKSFAAQFMIYHNAGKLPVVMALVPVAMTLAKERMPLQWSPQAYKQGMLVLSVPAHESHAQL